MNLLLACIIWTLYLYSLSCIWFSFHWLEEFLVKYNLLIYLLHQTACMATVEVDMSATCYWITILILLSSVSAGRRLLEGDSPESPSPRSAISLRVFHTHTYTRAHTHTHSHIWLLPVQCHVTANDNWSMSIERYGTYPFHIYHTAR